MRKSKPLMGPFSGPCSLALGFAGICLAVNKCLLENFVSLYPFFICLQLSCHEVMQTISCFQPPQQTASLASFGMLSGPEFLAGSSNKYIATWCAMLCPTRYDPVSRKQHSSLESTHRESSKHLFSFLPSPFPQHWYLMAPFHLQASLPVSWAVRNQLDLLSL